MLLTNVLAVVEEIEEEVLFDVEAITHWYEVSYEDKQLIIYEIDKYHENCNKWGKIIAKCNQQKIETIDCSIEEYLKFVIHFFKQKIMYIEYKYPANKHSIMKIDIRNDYFD